MIDLHSHLLSGLDDGPESVDDSLEIIKYLSSFGFTELVPTPHKFHALFNPVASEVIEKIGNLKRSMVKRFSFEYNCNLQSIKDLEDHHEICRTSDDRKVILVEFASGVVRRSEIENSVQSLNFAGFVPLMAHIERYFKKDEFWIELKKKYSVLFQGSIRTFAKPNFNIKKKQLIRLMELDLIDNLATDIHKVSQLVKIEKGLDFIHKAFRNYEKDLFTDKF
ncbi:hypothetical protein KA996_04685 [bacterium]|nr:hypothetical protein [bacterium]